MLVFAEPLGKPNCGELQLLAQQHLPTQKEAPVPLFLQYLAQSLWSQGGQKALCPPNAEDRTITIAASYHRGAG